MDEWIARIEKLLEHYNKGDYTIALKEGENFLKEAPSSLSTLLYIALADCVLQMDDTNRALDYMQKAREHFTDESLYIDEATLISKENLPYFYQGALVKCREKLAAVHGEESYVIQSLLAHCSYWLGDFEIALQQYELAFNLCVGNENLQEEAQVCAVGQARCYMELNNLEGAEKILLELYPVRRNLLSDESREITIFAAGRLACVYALQNRIPEARLMFQTDLNPDSFRHPYRKSSCYLHRGIVRFVANSLDGAREDLEQVAQAPIRKFDKLESLLYLGEIARRIGEKREAYRLYCELSLFPEVFLAKNAQALLSQISAEEEAPLREESEESLYTALTKKIAPKSAPVEMAQESPVTGDEDVWRDIPFPAILLGLETLEFQASRKK